MRLRGLLVGSLLLAVLCVLCAAEKREVYTCRELWDALGDEGVRHVVAMQAGSFNCSAADFPGSPLEIGQRDVLLEGEGPGLVYVDINRRSDVRMSDGGNFTVRGVWLDHCLGPDSLPLCLASVFGGGHLTLADMRLSDAACVNVRRSPGIQAVQELMAFTIKKQQLGKVVSDRSLFLKDTGWLHGAMPDSRWRITNTTLTCTGNTTHPLPDDFVDVEVGRLSPAVLAIGTTALLALTAALFWCSRSQALSSTLPEYRIAESRGFTLEEPLGSGHFGRVYRGTKKSTGQAVAIKVIDLLPDQRRQAAAAYRECQLISALHHECIVQVVTFYTAQVLRRRRRHSVATTTHSDEDNPYAEGYKAPAKALRWRSTKGTAGPVHDSSSSSPSPLTRPLPAVTELSGSGAGTSFSGSGPGTPLLDGPSVDGKAPAGDVAGQPGTEGVLSIQLQLVTQYCDLGTLDAAVKSGKFHDSETGLPKLSHILATALDIARGLEYLHHADRRMVHRDLSATNVLLDSSLADDRGFRVLLADFGLSTVLSGEETHKTSEIKGTISYMSPEVFIKDLVSPALDIYSLGIILHMMWAGKEPYAGETPAMTILSKVRVGGRLPALAGCQPAFQELVWDCTHHDRQSRPTAAQLVSRLETMLRR
ncbi:hypothetical protein D9Q98_004742 [Chlorella vulgaris]|uniref:Protein kinase domain-containing protein n=1 Tax=Chlorella vulgaris TaxID=3077 RepID=A0A9D4TQ91_CHLVU|nr:hypothetical protein D9Q98_004742 [Chlorella vulgaris]